MNKAVDVAAYILEKEDELTGYKIQKLLYYCHAWSLVTQGEALFGDRIQAWGHGPVVSEVAKIHRKKRTVYRADIPGDSNVVSDKNRLVIDAVLDSYGMLTGDQLAELSHQEDPWKKHFNGYNGAAAAAIPNDDIVNYYSKLLLCDNETKAKHHVPHIPDSKYIYLSDEDFEWLFNDEETESI